VCKRNMESVDHFLLHCDIACALWNIFFSCFGQDRLCLDEWSTCLLVGGLLVALRVLLCGRWCLLVFCGVFGGK
jgi:hypothetical protein